MQELFRRWYVPRADYLRMMELHAMEIAELRAKVEQLEAARAAESFRSLEEFELADFIDVPPVTVSNVVNVDFRPSRSGRMSDF